MIIQCQVQHRAATDTGSMGLSHNLTCAQRPMRGRAISRNKSAVLKPAADLLAVNITVHTAHHTGTPCHAQACRPRPAHIIRPAQLQNLQSSLAVLDPP